MIVTGLLGSGFNRYTVLKGAVHPVPLQFVEEGKIDITSRFESHVMPAQYPKAPWHDDVLSRLTSLQLVPLQLSMLRMRRWYAAVNVSIFHHQVVMKRINIHIGVVTNVG